MKHLIFRLFFIIVVIIGLVSYTVPWSNYGVQVPFSGADYRLGLDLQGGIELDYKVDLSEVSAEEDYDSSREKSIIEGLKSIIDKRVETLNINDSVITSASYAGEQHIIVQIPLKGNSDFENSENIRRAKEAIGRVVKIEFKELRQEITEADINARNELAYQISEELSQSEYDFSVTANKYVLSEENIRIGETTNFSAFSGVTAQSFTDTNIQRVQDERGDFGYIIVKKQTGENPNGIYDYLFVDARPSEWKPAADTEGRVLDDRYFVNSSVQFNDAFQPLIELTFNSDGAEIFGELTKRLVGKPIAIFVGGELLTSPTVNEPILTGRAVITGQYTPESARQLSNDINTGVVPAPIYLTSERSIDSKLGLNSLEQLVIAGMIGFLMIFVFLLVVYRSSGLIASIALAIYVMVVLAIVKSFGVVLTLASIAGLILSIGMAIDANVLIFERIRDELSRGKGIEEASVIGFKKSWSAIWDSNVTGFIVALILFIFGINLIKGFGLMLAIGIIVSLFTCYWISRVFTVLLARSIKNIHIFIGK